MISRNKKSFEIEFKGLPRVRGRSLPLKLSIGGAHSLQESQYFKFFQAGLTIPITAFNATLGKFSKNSLMSVGFPSITKEFKKEHSFIVSSDC